MRLVKGETAWRCQRCLQCPDVCLVSSLFTGCGIRAEGFSGSVTVTPELSLLLYTSIPSATWMVCGKPHPVQHNLKYSSGILLQSTALGCPPQDPLMMYRRTWLNQRSAFLTPGCLRLEDITPVTSVPGRWLTCSLTALEGRGP